MARLSLSEDTPLGAPVYRLQGRDPEGSPVRYSVSGQSLAVDRDTGVVTLSRPLDRETQDIIEVIISITDEEVGDGEEPNTVSLRREVPILDVNDNPPEFQGRPYSLVLSEHTNPGTVVFKDILVTDPDSGLNAELSLHCVSGGCQHFSISTEKVDDGKYRGVVTLTKAVDYESRASYSLVVRAEDASRGEQPPLSATATLAVSITDFQDQPPIFINAPYSATLQENTSPGYSIAEIKVKDGDHGNPRPVILSLEDDELSYFTLENQTVMTSKNPIDRENPSIIQSGGVYTFKVKATELINNELPGDFSYERVTVVITDVDDQIPHFNKPFFAINVTEDIGVGSALPGLNMVVSDEDQGENGRFSLKLHAVDPRVYSWLTVEPRQAAGSSPVVVRLVDNTGFDFDAGLTSFSFTVVVSSPNSQGEEVEVGRSEVQVGVMDANDNSPIFSEQSYTVVVREDLPPGASVANVTARDIDHGLYANVSYSLRGFGMDKFAIHSHNGTLFLINRVDYERQKTYSLTVEARDGGGRVSTAPLLVNVENVNDNPPLWEAPQYQRTLREGATAFHPSLILQAVDEDGEGETQVRYEVVSNNSDLLAVDSWTGEVTLTGAASSAHTSRGQYELVVRAHDDGVPPLYADVPVFVRVGVPGNQRPIFRGTPYNVTLPETALPGSVVITVKATDPDGPDSNITYRIAKGADNFNVNMSSGVVTVSSGALLDPDVSLQRRYTVVVLAVDSGIPLSETAQTMLTVNIQDVNNKPPYFPPSHVPTTIHISERTSTGTSILKVQAMDQDMDSSIKYRIKEVKAVQKSGVPLVHTATYDYKNVFRIDENTGDVILSSTLNHQSAAAIILTIEARDANAAVNIEDQVATVEVTIYIEAYDEETPQFLVGGWTVHERWVRGQVAEERPIGTVVLTLRAVDPRSGQPVTQFRPAQSSPSPLALDPNTPNIIVTNRIDYEAMDDKVITFKVEAVSNDGSRTSEAFIALKIDDINDHSPVFSQEVYKAEVCECAKPGSTVLTVEALDGDAANTSAGYGNVSYSLSGDGTDLFDIDANSGRITVSSRGHIDREKQSSVKLIVVATDTPQGGPSQRRTSAELVVEIGDENDNAPVFSAREYSAVVLETAKPGDSVVNVSATDLDAGQAQTIHYSFIDQGDAHGLFLLDKLNGEVRTFGELTGKGRREPYMLTVRAQDLGQPSLFSDAPLTVYIGDVVSNDGVPTFKHPTLDQIAYISENSSIGSPVFRVVAIDPDDPSSPEGQVKYSFLQDGGDSNAFSIDVVTGLITTKSQLDREQRSNYTLILVAQDSGQVVQRSTRQLTVVVTDIDDHKPAFNRTMDASPLLFMVEEEVPLNTTVGIITALDPDDSENAEIGYIITDGNEEGLFYLERLANNSAVLTAAGRLDRESHVEHTLVIKCFKLNLLPTSLRKSYNKQDFSESMVIVKLLDLDDNLPVFSDGNITVGARVSTPVDSLLTTVSASDMDEGSDAVHYWLASVNVSVGGAPIESIDDPTSFFSLGNETGELRTAVPLTPYQNSVFYILVAASNRPNNDSSFALIRVFVVKERGLMKFVFGTPPGEVRQSLKEFKQAVEGALSLPTTLNIYDTQFHSKPDGSLDFSSTSSCFQLVGAKIFDLKEMEALLLPETNPKIDGVYKLFNVQSVQRCSPAITSAEITWVQLTLLAIAALIGLASLISGCVLCCSSNSRY